MGIPPTWLAVPFEIFADAESTVVVGTVVGHVTVRHHQRQHLAIHILCTTAATHLGRDTFQACCPAAHALHQVQLNHSSTPSAQ
jgi:hypothetical protein